MKADNIKVGWCGKFSTLISTALDLKENSVQIGNKMLKLLECKEKSKNINGKKIVISEL
jgi:hypothetical protein